MKSYIHILNSVWNIREQGLISVYEQDLLLYLIHRCNRSGWVNPVPQSTKVICAVLGINRNALIRRRKRLEELGLMTIETGSNNTRTTYYRLHVPLAVADGSTATPQRQAHDRFVKPSVAEIAAYCTLRSNAVSAESFHNYYESKGWKVGNHPMKDWKAAVRTWELNSRKPQPTTIAHASAHHTEDKDYGTF